MAALVDAYDLEAVVEEKRDLEYPVTLVAGPAVEEEDRGAGALDGVVEVYVVVGVVESSCLVPGFCGGHRGVDGVCRWRWWMLRWW